MFSKNRASSIKTNGSPKPYVTLHCEKQFAICKKLRLNQSLVRAFPQVPPNGQLGGAHRWRRNPPPPGLPRSPPPPSGVRRCPKTVAARVSRVLLTTPSLSTLHPLPLRLVSADGHPAGRIRAPRGQIHPLVAPWPSRRHPHLPLSIGVPVAGGGPQPPRRCWCSGFGRPDLGHSWPDPPLGAPPSMFGGGGRWGLIGYLSRRLAGPLAGGSPSC